MVKFKKSLFVWDYIDLQHIQINKTKNFGKYAEKNNNFKLQKLSYMSK